jgi:hypothetical protein
MTESDYRSATRDASAGGLFSHDNLLAAVRDAGRNWGCDDASGGDEISPAGVTGRSFRTFGRSHDPAEKAHRPEAREQNVVLVFHAIEVARKPENQP